ncbi:50S ribosomal protein L13 [Candidatus Saccharibacteria bacterium]|nr:50S ribosomal protein L13 [Candidatus Saccharibacteria bacterium]
MKTYSQKSTEVKRKWLIVDASGISLGRLATVVATLLSGKHKPTFTPHTDGGDFVVVINAEKIRLSGNKLTDKKYYRHSGFPGNLKEVTAGEVLTTRPERVIEAAVRGMLPKNKLADGRIERLKIYAGTEHKHAAQKPVNYPIGAK